jgi:xylulokinase
MAAIRADASIYIGLDASTQSLTATAIEVGASRRSIAYSRTLEFDREWPHYGTRHGVMPSSDPAIAASPPLMWAEALERMMQEIAASGLDLARIRAISGSAQQHGSVYLAEGAERRIAALDPAHALAPQLDGCFSRAAAPIWMDTSTSEDCLALASAAGGPDALAELTGSRAFERFTGPQIRKFARLEKDRYARTERIHLVSSFFASLLAGVPAPVDPGDGSGTNLMDLRAQRWASHMLDATAPDLARRLPRVRESWSIVGPLAEYWTRRFGFPKAHVVTWSGDNPCSLVGVGLVEEGPIAISLGTSDTVFGLMREPRVDPSGPGHVFGAPTGDYMGLTCFANGSLARERIRDDYRLDWHGFATALRATPPGNRGAIMLPWLHPEITPAVAGGGFRRHGLGPGDVGANVRGVIEGQMLAMKLHSRWMGVEVGAIRATGGAAINREILQVMADVFGADVRQVNPCNSAALGAALRACHADRRASGQPVEWPRVVEGFVELAPEGHVRARREHAATYAGLLDAYARLESEALARAGTR